MPYRSTRELPDSVRNAGYSERCLRAFMAAANNALSARTGGGAASDEAAMKMGHAAARTCMQGDGMNSAIRERARQRGGQ